jgi:pyruvate dehydrogenase E1 component alpha subunit
MSLSKKLMVTLYTNLVRADVYDKRMYRRMLQGKLLGFYHSGEGGIAPSLAFGTLLRDDDDLFPHHRAHAIPGMLGKGVDLKYYLAEHTGKTTGCCAGRSSYHWSFPDKGIHLMSGYIGYQFGPAVGVGWAAKREKDRVVICSAGDGAYGEGRAHEAMLMAANWKLPIIFGCENNGMAIHSQASEMHPTENISSLAQGYDIPAVIVDGMDVFAVAEVAIKAIKHCRERKGPFFIEAKTKRFKEHDIGTPDLAGSTPRDDTVLAEMRERDPVGIATKRVLDDGIFTQEQINNIVSDAEKEVDAAWKFADDSPIATPSVEELLAAVYAP